MTTVCAKLTAGVDVNQTLGIAAVDVAAGGKTPVHVGAMASPRRRTARFAHASNALHPPWFSALAARLRRNEAETEQFLYERTRSPSTIRIAT
jgi:hypothetical protein